MGHSAYNDRELALDALGCAKAERHRRPGLLHHSDRGSVYASGDYRGALRDAASYRRGPRAGAHWDYYGVCYADHH